MEQFVISELQRATAKVYLPRVGIVAREKIWNNANEESSQYAEVRRKIEIFSYSYIMLCYWYEPCKPEFERKKNPKAWLGKSNCFVIKQIGGRYHQTLSVNFWSAEINPGRLLI